MFSESLSTLSTSASKEWTVYLSYRNPNIMCFSLEVLVLEVSLNVETNLVIAANLKGSFSMLLSFEPIWITWSKFLGSFLFCRWIKVGLFLYCQMLLVSSAFSLKHCSGKALHCRCFYITGIIMLVQVCVYRKRECKRTWSWANCVLWVAFRPNNTPTSHPTIISETWFKSVMKNASPDPSFVS